MHLRFNFDVCPMHSPSGFVHLTHQNLSARALFCLNSLAKVNTQLLIYNWSLIVANNKRKMNMAEQMSTVMTMHGWLTGQWDQREVPSMECSFNIFGSIDANEMSKCELLYSPLSSVIEFLVWQIIWKFYFPLRGYCTPGQFLDCFCIFLKNYNTLVTSKICFL